ncbi:MFS transporter [Nanchangia anserum]|uniref:Putative proline/betaine transporter n=1 Tax=Nanchangia anserum TaxID=2692125 RepID=A0A8I0GG24_9ACTO|nr:MFS transporter [Nanchangia anserum]MBD3689374.1 MFS transporter [Nanchangia anserum]QOX81581.1 MFS transporter [Nanchangia anserum]
MSTTKTTDDETGVLRKVAFASGLGNFIEWFDYGSYSYFAIVLSQIFFPAADRSLQLVQIYAVFALSFVLRPVGALVWGHLGDRLGRRWALSASILVMTMATFGIGLVPPYASIGIAAPILLLIMRAIQGFSASGEYAGASTFLAEYAPAHQRGIYVSLVPASTAGGLLAGAVSAFTLSAVCSPEGLLSWGWRLPFLIALPLGLVAWYIRIHLEDSPAYQEMQERLKHEASDDKPAHPILTLFKRYKKKLVIAFGVSCLNAVGFYIVLTYLPTYLEEEVNMSASTSTGITSVTLVGYVVLIFAMGHLSDKFGRKRMLVTACFAFMVLAIPAFMLLGTGSVAVILAVEIVMCVALTINDGTLASFLTETFPTEVRYSGFALSFNLANALLGGTAPMICTGLIKLTGSSMAPAWYLVTISAIALVAMAFCVDRSGEDLASSGRTD